MLAGIRDSGDAAELAEVLAVPTPVPLGPANILDEYEQAMAATAQSFNIEVSRIADALQQKAITEDQGEYWKYENPGGRPINRAPRFFADG